MKNHVLLSFSKEMTSEVWADTVVRVNGGYSPDSPILGVASDYCESGKYSTINLRGLLSVKIADNETVQIGDILGVDAMGQGVSPNSGNKVSDFALVVKVESGYAIVNV